MRQAKHSIAPPAQQTRPLQSFQRDQTLVKVGRRSIVGSNNPTAPVIEASYPQCIGALKAGLAHQLFLRSDRPAFSGPSTQLSQCDPPPRD
jgi:hypothetical protein